MSDVKLLPGFTANADLSAKRYHLVKYSSSKVCAAITAEGDIPIGVLTNAPTASGEVADIQYEGQCEAMVGEAVSAGQRLCVGAAGRLMLSNAGSRNVAIALQDGSGDGSVINVDLDCRATGDVLA